MTQERIIERIKKEQEAIKNSKQVVIDGTAITVDMREALKDGGHISMHYGTDYFVVNTPLARSLNLPIVSEYPLQIL